MREPASFGRLLFIIPVREHEVVGGDSGVVPGAEELEAHLLAFSRLHLYIAHLMRRDGDLAEELLAANGLNEKGAILLGAEVPMEVILVEERSFGGSRAQNTVRMLGNPAPE